MKITIKKIYITFFLFILLFNQHNVLAKNSKIQYKSENISNYFLGVISSNQDFSEEAFQYLKKVQSLKDRHYKFNIEFIRTLVLLNKFDKALDFSKDIWEENELFFEADLLLGIDSFLNEDHKNAEKYFKSLNELNKSLALENMSMGMSADYVEAINHGANFVRIGSSIFGSRS